MFGSSSTLSSAGNGMSRKGSASATRVLRSCRAQGLARAACFASARAWATRSTIRPPNNNRFHLMYVCARNVLGSTGFPVETARLREHLFPRFDEDKPTDTLVDAMSKKLVQLFDFVMQAPDPSIVDEQLFQLFTRKPEAQDPFCKPPSGSPLRRRKSHEKTRVLVIAIDEARALLPTQPDAVNIGWFRCFRRALYQANDVLRTAYGDRSGIFGIVVDTNSRVSDFVPSARLDPSKRTTDRVLFPPFVLTDTVDVFYKVKLRPPTELVRFYRDRVLAAVANAASRNKSTDPTSWKDLRKLGRPLWGSRMWRHRDLITLAAEKLLGGGSTLTERALTDGVGAIASVMCRLGIRPYMSTPLATQLVADYMAVLSYVSCEREHFFVSYSSDPILTLGAARLWHFGVDTAGSSSNLSRYILPQLKVLLRQEVLDTGGVGEFVARIVLLLAMDACAVLETDNEDMRWSGGGEFYSVPTFLQALAGTSVDVHQHRGRASTTMADVHKAMETRWGDYFVSFTHFVQLSEEPNETCLWGLLGRRAAAMLPRGQRGADLIIPICLRRRKQSSSTSRPLVSMILVQVKNHERGYSSFIKAVTKKMDPEFVFSEANPLRDTAPGNVLRVLMSLREPRPRHAYVEDPREAGSYALCIFGLQAWSSLLRKGGSGKTVEVVSPAVASELSEMLGPWWRVAEMVKVDMEKCARERRIESDSALLMTALHPLGDVLVLNQCLPTTGES
jgi:hypothetical protein